MFKTQKLHIRKCLQSTAGKEQLTCDGFGSHAGHILPHSLDAMQVLTEETGSTNIEKPLSITENSDALSSDRL